MVPFKYEQFVEDVIFLVESGKIPMTRIDDAVERILRVKFVAGLFEHPFSDRSLLDIVGCKVNIGENHHIFDFIQFTITCNSLDEHFTSILL